MYEGALRGRKVTIKNAGNIERIAFELNIMCSLSHPNLRKVLAFLLLPSSTFVSVCVHFCVCLYPSQFSLACSFECWKWDGQAFVGAACPNSAAFLQILGVMLDTQVPRILLEHVSRGSVRSILDACKESNRPMVEGGSSAVWLLKLNLALGTSKGMHFLHSQTPPIIHRDLKVIKSGMTFLLLGLRLEWHSASAIIHILCRHFLVCLLVTVVGCQCRCG